MGVDARVWRGLSAGGPRRRLIGSLLAGLVLGLGGVTVAVGDVNSPWQLLMCSESAPAARGGETGYVITSVTHTAR